MMRSWAVVFAVIAFAGCRSAQQPTNPFLRTTVPPPGTGEAAVVVPGDPYYPGSTPTPSPAVPPATPPVATAPVAPQPVVPPPRDRNKPVPGGDYFYHQSAVEPTRGWQAHGHGGPSSDDEGRADDATGIAVNSMAPNAISLGGRSDAVAQAIALSQQPGPVETARFDEYGGNLPSETVIQRDMTEPLAAPATTSQPRGHAGGEVRILGSNLHDADTTAPDPHWSSRTEPTARAGVA